jgi:hypothetical protein
MSITFAELAGDLDIGGARRRIAGGMIVGERFLQQLDREAMLASPPTPPRSLPAWNPRVVRVCRNAASYDFSARLRR